ncbi:MAG: DUF4837 family protein [Marinilabiliaceae bacterium]|nr:DUF4837 family protein [Marinilabiliaceae bacterium]
MKHILLALLTLSLFFLACKNEKLIKPNPTGNAGDILVVVNDSIKKSNAGQFIKEFIQQPMLGLPQEEPLFKLLTAPHREFDGQLMTFRNIITININPKVKKDSIAFYKDLWAKDQSVARIISPSKEQLLLYLKNNEIKLIGYFLSAERKRNIDYFKAYPNAELVDVIKKDWNLYLAIPNTFKKNKSGNDFSWFSEEGPVHSLGLIIYSFNYVGEGTFSKEYLLNKRDSVLRINIPGSAPGSYMSTEHQVKPIYKTLMVDGDNSVEIRGLWKVEGDIMGGPFISHAHHDTLNSKVIVTEGYVYSPEKPNKRNFMWQMEAILYTYKKINNN